MGVADDGRALDFVPRTVFAEDAPRDEARSGETSPGKDAVASAPYRPGSNMRYNSATIGK
jgi:hypothetical protein